jgi:hypothetical protein
MKKATDDDCADLEFDIVVFIRNWQEEHQIELDEACLMTSLLSLLLSSSAMMGITHEKLVEWIQACIGTLKEGE